jgi:hypothetical protein
VGLGLLLPPPTLIASAPGGCHSRAPTTREVENSPQTKTTTTTMNGVVEALHIYDEHK